MKKLIIWDFDGVIADTEKLWIENRLYFLRRDYNINWSFDEAYKYIGGISERDKIRNLKNLGYEIKDQFWRDSNQRDYETLKDVLLTPYIEDIFKLQEFDQCIATGGIMERTARKIKQTGVDKYFDDKRIFTVDMVAKGKPEPDLFLYAADKMGYNPQDGDLIINLFDASTNTPQQFENITKSKTILVANKIDKLTSNQIAQLQQQGIITISAKQKIGIDVLLNTIADNIKNRVASGSGLLITRHRYREALKNTVNYLNNFNFAKEIELSAEDIRLASRELGKITGFIEVDEILDKIFGSFCIGK